MIDFELNAPGILYKLNYSKRPDNRGSSGGVENTPYMIVEQNSPRGRLIISPNALYGLQIKKIDPDTYRVISLDAPKEDDFVGILGVGIDYLPSNHPNRLDGFVRRVKPFQNFIELEKYLKSYSRLERFDSVAHMFESTVDKSYKELIKKIKTNAEQQI